MWFMGGSILRLVIGLATFLASTSLDLDSTEVTGSSSSTPSYPSHDPRDEKEIETLMRSEGDEKDDERDDERDDSFPLEASLGKTEADLTTSLGPWGTSTPNMASVSELMSGRKKCPDLTLMSSDGKLAQGRQIIV
ncbi:uncharacterized protein LOC121879988 [Homarus americanus]|uniref:Uncharacterized protein n=1 Tax=Homarus americanus TaxID=6706 RepID=A0A8J5MNE1_HOMAM|nr:uncharacterized protein LOC121879988 [Homarus americanus]KAG7157507.1 hypothetical protein Hamer_G024287 [Homarus americanus]